MQVRYWDSLAAAYDSLYVSEWSLIENGVVRQHLSWLAGIEEAKVLDLGCGTGLGYEICHAINATIEYTGIDISPSMIEICKKKWPKGTFKLLSMDNLSGVASDHFDVVISLFSSFSFSDKPRCTLPEVYRVLRPGGMTYISLLSKWSLRRLLNRHLSSIEYYYTRNSVEEFVVPAWVFSKKEVVRLFNWTGFKSCHVQGLGIFSGLFERPYLWSLDQRLSNFFPDLTHMLTVTAEK